MFALYIKILKQAFSLAKTYNIFWLASLFLVWPNLFKSIIILLLGAGAFGVALYTPQESGGANQSGVIWGVVFGAAAAFLIWAYFRARNVVMITVKQLQQTSKPNWPEINRQSTYKINSLITVSYSCMVTIAAFVAIYLSPVLYLSSMEYSARASVLLFFGLVVFVPLIYFAYACMRLMPLFTVVYKMSTKNSLLVSLDLAYRRWWLITGFMMVILVIELLALGLTVGVVLLANQPFVILAQIFYDVGGLNGLMTLSGLAGIAVFMLFFVLQASVAGFSHIAWTLLFLQVVRPINFADPEPELVEPETAV